MYLFLGGFFLTITNINDIYQYFSLLTWKRPGKTRMLLWILFGMAVSLSFLPTRYMTKLVFLWVGIEFFVLQSLRSHYKRHRRLFNIIDWVLWGVPNDAEYAMEVLRLHRKAEDDEQLHNGGKTAKETKRLWRRSGNNNNSSEEHQEQQEEGKDQQATSTAATLAIMVAGAAAGQVKHALDEQFERKRNQQDQDSDSSTSVEATGHSTQIKPSGSVSNLFERKGSQASINTNTNGESEILESKCCGFNIDIIF